MTTVDAPAGVRSPLGKLASLRAVAGTGTPSALGRFDQAMMIGGLVMIPIGIIAVLLGWYGAAKTPWSFEQIPYLISGGLLGVGLMFTGSILYLASWISRLAGQDREQAAQARALLAAMEAELREMPEALAATNGSAKAAVRTGFVATPTGSMFHTADCTVVADRDDVRRVSEKQTADMKPCRMCEPLAR